MAGRTVLEDISGEFAFIDASMRATEQNAVLLM